MRHILAILTMLATLWGASPLAADTAEKFGWIELTEGLTRFHTDPPALGFETYSPEGFVWRKTDETPSEFAEAGVFSSLRQIYTGTGPEGSKGLEIRVYAATIVPDRVLLGAGYAQILAARWGRMDFGILARSRDFGEVLGGERDSETRHINRISVIRRGSDLLILRSRFAAEDFPRWATEIARFHGSLRFDVPLAEDPIAAMFNHDALPLPDMADFAFSMPGTWAELLRQTREDPQMTASFWADQSDPKGNNGAMIVAIAPPKGQPGAQPDAPEEQAMNNFAAQLASAALSGLLPEQTYELAPKNKMSFADFDEITLTQGIYYFAAAEPGQKPTIKVSVLMSMGPNGALLGAVGLSAPGPNLYLLGGSYHGDFVTKLQMSAQERYWREQAAR